MEEKAWISALYPKDNMALIWNQKEAKYDIIFFGSALLWP